MSKLKKIREQKNLTQEELSVKSGISVRTIQRIEAGTNPKGYTLKTLVNILEIQKSDLLEHKQLEIIDEESNTDNVIKIQEDNSINYSKIKIINMSSILFVIFPPLNIITPIILSTLLKQKNDLTKQIVSVQIIWTILAPIIFFIGIFLKLGRNFTLVLIIGITLSNIFIILSNAYEIDKKRKLRYVLNFNLI